MCHLEELGLASRCLILPVRPAMDAELLTCHRSDPVPGVGQVQDCREVLGEGPGALLPWWVELLPT